MIVPEILTREGLRASAEMLQVFNAGSGGTIELVNQPALQAIQGGDYTESVRFKRPSGLVVHTVTATPGGALSAVAITQGKGAGVRWKGTIFASFTDDEVSSGALNQEQYNAALAQLFEEERLLKIRDLALSCGVAAIQSADTTDGSTASADIHILSNTRGKAAGATKTITVPLLNTLLNKMGDARSRIKTFAMHSAIWGDYAAYLLGSSGLPALESVAGAMMARDVAAMMGRNALVMDSPSLYTAKTSTYYTDFYVLGLGASALRAVITEMKPVEVMRLLNTNVVTTQIRQDFTVEFFVRGMKWLVSGAIPNPTDAQLATAASWDEDYENHKDCPIVMMTTNAAQPDAYKTA
jgi:hypothetical protein